MILRYFPWRNNKNLSSGVFHYLQVADTVAVDPEHPVGTVYERFGSLSQLTDDNPLVFCINLYSNDVPTGIVTWAYHRLLDEVY